MIKKRFLHAAVTVLFCIILTAFNSFGQHKAETLQGWENLHNAVPGWLQDAKFGIYFHWGLYTVPAYNSEWYSRNMYVAGTNANKHQIESHGSLKQFGYKDYIPLFTAEHFNANEWADLFARAGAKFAGPVAEHADGFSMWGSKVNRWNAQDMGPKKDIVKEMQQAIRKRKLKFITTFHHQWQWGWYPTFDTAVDAGNPAYADLYGPVVSVAAWQQKDTAERPNEAFNKRWLAKVEEVVKKYRPDVLYFDSRLGHIGETYRKQMVSTFFSTPADRKEKVILYKGKDLPEGLGMSTHEKTRLNHLADKPWLTEEPISTYSWSYTSDIVLRSAKDILNGLIDIVSKNGVYLLNICPKSDGTIPKDQQEILLTIGGWLGRNGEAVYNTRPWYTYGEGPAVETEKKSAPVDRSNYYKITFTGEDIRYTRNGNIVYASILGKPEESNKILLKAFAKSSIPGKMSIGKITIIGSREKIEWEYLDSGLSIKLPEKLEETMATVFKIETFDK